MGGQKVKGHKVTQSCLSVMVSRELNRLTREPLMFNDFCVGNSQGHQLMRLQKCMLGRMGWSKGSVSGVRALRAGEGSCGRVLCLFNYDIFIAEEQHLCYG